MIDDVSKLVSEIRNIINKKPKQKTLMQNEKKWLMLTSCLDVIDDIEIAFEAYGKCYPWDNLGINIIYAYGILQGLYLQQDAVNNLHSALDIVYLRPNELTEIRKIRNDSIGHPTNRNNGDSFNYISQGTINKSGFQLITIFPDKDEPEFQDINLPERIKQQQKIIYQKLSEVIQNLKLS